MTYTDAYRESVLAEARQTLKRTSAENLARHRDAEPKDSGVRYTEPIETSSERWRREMGELEEERDAERQRLADVQQLHREMIKSRSDVAAGLRAVNQFAATIVARLEEVTEENTQLKNKLSVLETRFEDLKRSVDARGAQPSAEVVELPNPLGKRRA
jgi:hypothetical protein